MMGQCWCPSCRWMWMARCGLVRIPQSRGWPVRAKIAFCPNPVAPLSPRTPWKYETETRAPGTGLVMGMMPFECARTW
jgi:hypothetical protein